MKINPAALMSDAEWDAYNRHFPEMRTPLPPTAPTDYGPKAKYRRIFTMQKPCGCLVTRFEPYVGRAREAECPHG